MAGTNEAFDAGTFRDSIRFAMTMGAPNAVNDRATFIFPKTRTFPTGTSLDSEGEPFDPTIAPVIVQPPSVQVPIAFEFKKEASPEEVPVGSFRNTRIEITILDEDYETIKEAEEVMLGGDTYLIAYVKPPLGLFDVTIYQMIAYARDEK